MDGPTGDATRTERASSTASTVYGYGTSPRRASASSGLFHGLHAQKRSSDPAQQARRQSISEQRPQAGFIGSMWNNWVYGTSPPSK